MAGDWIPVLIAIGVPLFLRVLDYLMPAGRRFKMLDRWTVEDEDEAEEK